MKILFAVSNEKIATAIKKQYQENYKGVLTTKNVYYFNAIIKELQNDKTYDVVIISEDLEPFASNNGDAIDKFLIGKLMDIREESKKIDGNNTPIILITTERHTTGDNLLNKLYEIGIYNALIGENRTIRRVCELVAKPRNKEAAKKAYGIVSVGVQEDSDNDVKEAEIKNIIAHYKKLGKSEERYVESFDNIASQYNDAQLKVIIKFLPLNVKAVLEEKSTKYQEIMTFGHTPSKKISSAPKENKKIKESDKKVKQNTDILLEQLSDIKSDGQVVVPKAVSASAVKKVGSTAKKTSASKVEKEAERVIPQPVEPKAKVKAKVVEVEEVPELPMEEEEEEIIEQEVVQPVKRGRGRPKKIKTPEEEAEEAARAAAPKKRGRPKKVQPVVEEEEEEIILPKKSKPSSSVLPGFEIDEDEEEEDISLFDLTENESEPEIEEEPEEIEEVDELLPGFEDEEEEEYEEEEPEDEYEEYEENDEDEEYLDIDNNISLPVEDEEEYEEELDEEEDIDDISIYDEPISSNNIDRPYETQFSRGLTRAKEVEYNYQNIEHLVSRDKKIVSFIGTSKNGTSFIVNNIAQMLSSMNINTAILDMTKNKNSYYIYTQNDEALRQKANLSIDKLRDGKADGIVVNRNLTVYTATPNYNEQYVEADLILKTLIQNYSLVLIDCDFDTPLGYFDNSQEIYLIQSMDILTIQPLTAFLRDLKSKDVLKQEKIRVIINKAEKVKGLNEKVLVGGIAYYNDPSMSFMTELFDKNTVRVISIPFDITAYTKYLGTLVDCKVSLNGYPKNFINQLKKLASMIYPLLSSNPKGGRMSKNQSNMYAPPSVNNFQRQTFTPGGAGNKFFK